MYLVLTTELRDEHVLESPLAFQYFILWIFSYMDGITNIKPYT